MVSINKRWVDISKLSDIPKSLLLEAIELCVDAAYFVFKGIHSSQVIGLPMVSSLTPITVKFFIVEQYFNRDPHLKFTLRSGKQFIHQDLEWKPFQPRIYFTGRLWLSNDNNRKGNLMKKKFN